MFWKVSAIHGQISLSPSPSRPRRKHGKILGFETSFRSLFLFNEANSKLPAHSTLGESYIFFRNASLT